MTVDGGREEGNELHVDVFMLLRGAGLWVERNDVIVVVPRTLVDVFFFAQGCDVIKHAAASSKEKCRP
jgi:hypothetical protein